MELRHLRYFKAVADRLSFTLAARQLGIAQPPLSAQIRNLEREIGTPLFTRTPRSVRLTPAGRTLLDAANDILGRADQAVTRIQDELAGRTGEIVISYTTGAICDRLTRRIRKFGRKNRGTRLTLVPATQAPAADLWLTDAPGDAAGTGAVLVQEAGLQLAVAPKHRLAGRTSVDPSDLVGESVFLAPREHRSAAEEIGLRWLVAGRVPFRELEDAAPPAERRWRVALGLGVAFCASTESEMAETVRIPLNAEAARIAILATPNPASRAAGLAGLLGMLRLSEDETPAPPRSPAD